MSLVKTHKILVVDDEQGVLNAIRRELSSPFTGHHHYQVEVFTHPKEALERAAETTFEAVISDYRMPEMNGITFLKQFAKLQPDCPRIAISAHADMEILTQFINEALLFRFLQKPWNSDQLRQSIAQAIARHLRDLRRKRFEAEHAADAWVFAKREHCLITQDGILIKLTDVESTLVETMLLANGKPASRKQLIEALGHDFMTYDERRIEVKVSRLRKKIRDVTGGQEPIRAEWGSGYLFIQPCDFD